MGAAASVDTESNSIEAMTPEEIADLVSALGSSYEKYSSTIIASEIDGLYLISMIKKLDEVLDDIGVTSKVHRSKISKLLITAYKKNQSNEEEDDEVEVEEEVVEEAEEEEDVEEGGEEGDIELDEHEVELKSNAVIDDVVTIDPRTLMTNIFKIQGIKLDPTDVDPSVAKIAQAIGHDESCDGDETYDCFINYRVATEANTAMTLYLELKTQGINAFLDKKCLKDGEDWKQGFLRGLRNSRQFVALISSDALSQVRNFEVDHSYDNVLIEYQAALKIKGIINKANYFVPVHVGKVTNNTLTKFGDFNPNLYSPSIGPIVENK